MAKPCSCRKQAAYRILKIDLARLSNLGAAPAVAAGAGAGAATVLVDNLPGYPDNLMRSDSGRLWVGLTKPAAPGGQMAAWPGLRQVVLRLPRALRPVPKAYGHVIAFDEQGRIGGGPARPEGRLPGNHRPPRLGGKLFIQSLHAHSLAWLPILGSKSDAPGIPGGFEDQGADHAPRTRHAKRVPCFKAKCVPMVLPATLATAMGNDRAQATWPCGMNQASAARLVAKFSRLAAALACRKSQPRPHQRKHEKAAGAWAKHAVVKPTSAAQRRWPSAPPASRGVNGVHGCVPYVFAPQV